MAMNLSAPDSDEIMVDINTTPLIDVMLVLIIMLIITIPVQTHAVNLDMPRGDPPQVAMPPEIVRLDIDFDGTLLWNGLPLADRVALERQLRSAAMRQPQPEIHVQPNKLAKYGSVATVLAEAQRVGVLKIGIAGNADF